MRGVLLGFLSVVVSTTIAGAVTLDPGDLVVVDEDARAVIRVVRASGAQTVITAGSLLVTPSALARDVDGTLIVADQDALGGALIRVDPATGKQTVISSGGEFVNPGGIVIDGARRLIVADRDAGKIFAVDPLDGKQILIASGGLLARPTGITLDVSGALVIADQDAFGGGGGLIRVEPGNGAQGPIGSGGAFANPRSVAVDGAGRFVVADADALGGLGALLLVDPRGAEPRVVSAGGVFSHPTGVTIDADGHAIVADQLAGALIRVNTATGEQVVIASGGHLVGPTGVLVIPGGPEPPFARSEAKCQRAIGTATGQLARQFQKLHAGCLDAEAAGRTTCDLDVLDRKIASAVEAATDRLKQDCDEARYHALGFVGTAGAIRDRLVGATLRAGKDLIREAYPANYATKP
jgi:sugar lactone lactonase YvrE